MMDVKFIIRNCASCSLRDMKIAGSPANLHYLIRVYFTTNNKHHVFGHRIGMRVFLLIYKKLFFIKKFYPSILELCSQLGREEFNNRKSYVFNRSLHEVRSLYEAASSGVVFCVRSPVAFKHVMS